MASVERECEERESRENEAQNQCESFKSKPYKRESRENSQVGVYSVLKAGLIFPFLLLPQHGKRFLCTAPLSRAVSVRVTAPPSRVVSVCVSFLNVQYSFNI